MMNTIGAAHSSALPEVALPFMNTIHREEMLLVKKLLIQLSQQATPKIIDRHLQAWVEHTEAHFAEEERLMAEHDFFAYPAHQTEHEQVLQELRTIQQQWLGSRNYAALQSYIGNWRAWLEQHISSMDFVTAHFLSQFELEAETA